jgi:hypothetical protein
LPSEFLSNDVWFDVDLAKTIETDLVEVNDVIANLPNLAGFGNVHSLHQAMALDTSGELQDLVEQVISASGAEQNDALTQMIYHWTGVEDIDPNSRTAGRMHDNVIVDARKLKALEELTGKEWLGTWWEGDPDRNPQAPILLKAFDDLQLYIKDKLFYDNNNLLSKIRILLPCRCLALRLGCRRHHHLLKHQTRYHQLKYHYHKCYVNSV